MDTKRSREQTSGPALSARLSAHAAARADLAQGGTCACLFCPKSLLPFAAHGGLTSPRKTQNNPKTVFSFTKCTKIGVKCKSWEAQRDLSQKHREGTSSADPQPGAGSAPRAA